MKTDYLACSSCRATYAPRRRGPGIVDVYELGNGALAPVLPRLAWCAECKNITQAELIPDQATIDSHLRQIAAQLASQRERLGYDLYKYVRTQRTTLYQLYLAHQRTWRSWALAHESRRAKCLECSAPACALEARELAGGEEAYRHPSCAGFLRWKSVPNLHISRNAPIELEMICFGPDGSLLASGDAARSRTSALLGESEGMVLRRKLDLIKITIAAVQQDPRFRSVVATWDWRALSSGLSLDMDFAAMWTAIGKCLAAASIDDATACWQKALEEEPGHESAAKALAAAYMTRHFG